ITELTVTFTADSVDNGETVLAWGGHLAVTTGPTFLGASYIGGAPFHMDAAGSYTDSHGHTQSISGGGQMSIHHVAGPGSTPATTPAIDLEKLESFDSGNTWYYQTDGGSDNSATIALEFQAATGISVTAADFTRYDTTPPSVLSGHDPEYAFLVN